MYTKTLTEELKFMIEEEEEYGEEALALPSVSSLAPKVEKMFVGKGKLLLSVLKRKSVRALVVTALAALSTIVAIKAMMSKLDKKFKDLPKVGVRTIAKKVPVAFYSLIAIFALWVVSLIMIVKSRSFVEEADQSVLSEAETPYDEFVREVHKYAQQTKNKKLEELIQKLHALGPRTSGELMNTDKVDELLATLRQLETKQDLPEHLRTMAKQVADLVKGEGLITKKVVENPSIFKRIWAKIKRVYEWALNLVKTAWRKSRVGTIMFAAGLVTAVVLAIIVIRQAKGQSVGTVGSLFAAVREYAAKRRILTIALAIACLVCLAGLGILIFTKGQGANAGEVAKNAASGTASGQGEGSKGEAKGSAQA
jgi:hypothetical protein